jgi:hypothetical protein
VETVGLEPTTPCLQSRCSNQTELRPRSWPPHAVPVPSTDERHGQPTDGKISTHPNPSVAGADGDVIAAIRRVDADRHRPLTLFRNCCWHTSRACWVCALFRHWVNRSICVRWEKMNAPTMAKRATETTRPTPPVIPPARA